MPSVVAKGLGRVFFPDEMGQDAIAAAMPKVTQQLQMDYASRMQRAKEQGFDVDTTYYHGTNRDISNMDPSATGVHTAPRQIEGAYVTDSPLYASDYARAAGENVGYKEGVFAPEGGSVVYPTLTKSGKTKTFTDVDEFHDSQREDLIDQGYSAAELLDVNGEVSERVILDPSNIRSVNAAFDPAKKGSSDLLASIGAGTGISGLALYTPEQNAALASRLDKLGLPMLATGDRIEPEEFPKLEYIADFLDKNTQTPIGPAFEGISNYLRGFGDDADAKERAKRAFGAALDIM